MTYTKLGEGVEEIAEASLLKGHTATMEKEDTNVVDKVTWRFGVTVANSESTGTNNTYLQVKFIKRNGKSVHVEMDLRQFNNLLQALEKAKLELDRL